MTSLSLLVLLLLGSLGVLGHNCVKDEHGVYVINDSNFHEFLDETEILLIEFYAPWCSHCKKLAPKWAEVANILHDSTNVKVAKVDATLNEILADTYDVTDYPAIKLINEGIVYDFEGNPLTSDLVGFVQFKIGPPAIHIETLADFLAIESSLDVFVMGLFSSHDSYVAQEFMLAGAEFQTPRFYYSIVEEVGEYLNSQGKDKIFILKKYDDYRTELEPVGNVEKGWTFDEIFDFVKDKWLPIVIPYSDQNSNVIFKSELKVHALLFAKKDNLLEYNTCYMRLANKHKEELVFVSVTTDDEDAEAEGVMQFFDIAGSQPTMRIVEVNTQAKYTLAGKLSCEKIEKFVEDYLQGELETEGNKPLDSWDAEPVKLLNDFNINTVALEKSTWSFILFYAPWDNHSKVLLPKWKLLAEYYDDDKEIIIAKIDSSRSSVQHYPVKQYPTLVMFGKGDGAQYEFEGERDLDIMKEWIKSVRTGVVKPSVNDVEGHNSYGAMDGEQNSDRAQNLDENSVKNQEEYQHAREEL
eukprot:CFRG1893T1